MELEERIERLEKLYEGIYHDYELLAIYIPRLTDILIKYFQTGNSLRYDIFGDFNSLQSVLTNILDDLQIHYKAHSDEVKRKVDASKRKTNRYNIYTP